MIAVAHANADTFYTIDGVTSDTAGTDFFSAANLIQGAGVGFDSSEPHNRTSSLTWVTNAPNGGSGDYFAPTPTPGPRLVFDLGDDVPLSEISLWGYANDNGNGASEVSLRFATEADGTGAFGSTITYNPTFNLIQNVTPRQSFSFDTLFAARYVEVTPVDNFYGGPSPGGDRVGLGEVAFETGGQVVTPVGVTSNAAGGPDFYAVGNLINGSGLSAPPTIDNIFDVTHAGTGSTNSWVTQAPGGAASDFYASTVDVPVLEFDLGGDFTLVSIVAWNYAVSGNAAGDFTAEFFLDGNAVGGPVSLTFPQAAAAAHSISLGGAYRADTVRITITDNYFGEGSGGDRVGLAEIRFIAIPEPSSLGLLALVAPVLIRRRAAARR